MKRTINIRDVSNAIECCLGFAMSLRLFSDSWGLNLRDCQIYLDDIIMLSETVDNHDAVFYRLHEHNSGLKPPSASFLMTT